jgi:beta-N-acetylhexosaminidase
MSELRNSFGNHLIVGVSGTSLSDEDKHLLAEVKPVGVIFFAKNFVSGVPYEVWLERYKELHDAVHQYAERDDMLVTIDHEGGSVVRTPPPITRFPLPALYKDRAEEVARASALELKSLGVNVSWAPCADVHSNPANPIIGPRAFGCDPQRAAQYASAYLRGLEAEGVRGCAKHFPGHGDTLVDSHFELPVLGLTRKELEQRELIPFAALVKEGVELIMTAHIMFPQIDPHVPATLSRTILHDILRQQLGYHGVVVSDDIDMKAVADSFTTQKTLVQSFEASCDMFIVSRFFYTSSERTLAMAKHLSDALDSQKLSEELVLTSQKRVQNLLAGTKSYGVEPLQKELLLKHAALSCDVAYNS